MNDGVRTGAPPARRGGPTGPTGPTGSPGSPGSPGSLGRSGPAVQRVDVVDLAAAERAAASVDALLARVPADAERAAARSWLQAVDQVLPLAGAHDRARLLQARARLHTEDDAGGRCYPADEVLADAVAAAELFEQLGDPLVAATNFAVAADAAAHAGRITLALETAVRALVALGEVAGTGVADARDADAEARLALRLGALCRQLFDYPRALRFYELAVAALPARRDGRTYRDDDAEDSRRAAATAAIAELLLLHVAELAVDDERRAAALARAEQLARELTEPDRPEAYRQVHGPRLLADVLCEHGRGREAWSLLLGVRAAIDRGAAVPATGLHLSCGRCLLLLGLADDAVGELDAVLDLLGEPVPHPGAGDGRLTDAHLGDRLAALRLRSLARQAAGDVSGALADARRLAELLWTRQRHQVGGFLDQVWSRAGAEGERRDLQERTRALLASAEQDPLTGLANRRALERFRSELGPHDEVSLVLVDVDHFKAVNDRFGHAVGDEALRELGGLLTRSVRSLDVVTRWGGEEFLIALPGSGPLGADAAARVCRRVRAHPWSRLAEGLRITVSAGVASGPAGLLDAVLDRADTALYAAKNGGRDRAVSC